MRILLVDDDPHMHWIVEHTLAATGDHEVQVMSDGEELRTNAPGAQPDVILLDLQVGSEDGRAILTELQQHDGLKTVPVIFLTASANAARDESLTELGAKGVIAKPFRPTELVETIEGILESS